MFAHEWTASKMTVPCHAFTAYKLGIMIRKTLKMFFFSRPTQSDDFGSFLFCPVMADCAFKSAALGARRPPQPSLLFWCFYFFLTTRPVNANKQNLIKLFGTWEPPKIKLYSLISSLASTHQLLLSLFYPLSFSLYIYPFIFRLSIYLSSIYYLSMYLSTYFSIYISIYLRIYAFLCLYNHISFYLSIYLCIYLSFYLSFYPSLSIFKGECYGRRACHTLLFMAVCLSIDKKL